MVESGAGGDGGGGGGGRGDKGGGGGGVGKGKTRGMSEGVCVFAFRLWLAMSVVEACVCVSQLINQCFILCLSTGDIRRNKNEQSLQR